MFKRDSICIVCGRDIQAGEEVYAKMKYPKNKAMTEIKAYLQKKSEIICKECFNVMKK